MAQDNSGQTSLLRYLWLSEVKTGVIREWRVVQLLGVIEGFAWFTNLNIAFGTHFLFDLDQTEADLGA